MKLIEVVKKYKKHTRKTQKKIYESLSSKFYGVCLRYASDNQKAQDYLHNGFLKIFESIDKYHFKGSFEGWARRVVVNSIIDDKRSERLVFIEENSSTFHNIEDEAVDKIEDMKALQIIKMIQKLSPQYKLVFNLYVIEDYSHKEISEKLDISIGTSKSNLFNAKRRIREMLI